MEIEQICAKDYKGYTKEFKYWTKAYYDIIKDDNGFKLQLKEFTKPIQKSFVGTLFSDRLECPVVFGAFVKRKLVGFIEGSIESWHDLFRINNLLVEEEYRHLGIGDKLMNKICDYAIQHTQARAFILETESCNTPAIGFYKQHGFDMVGLNLMDYTNDDIAMKEVHFEFGKKINRYPRPIYQEVKDISLLKV